MENYQKSAFSKPVPKKPSIFIPKNEMEKLFGPKDTISYTRGELEGVFELPKGTLPPGQSLLPHKGYFLEEMNRSVSNVKFYQVEADGKLSVFTGSAKASTKKFNVFIDFGRYLERVESGVTNNIGYLLRIDAKLSVVKGEVDLGSIFAIGFAAKGGQISGEVKIQTWGLGGKEIENHTATFYSLSEETLFKALENFAVLKSKIYTDGIVVSPALLPGNL